MREVLMYKYCGYLHPIYKHVFSCSNDCLAGNAIAGPRLTPRERARAVETKKARVVVEPLAPLYASRSSGFFALGIG